MQFYRAIFSAVLVLSLATSSVFADDNERAMETVIVGKYDKSANTRTFYGVHWGDIFNDQVQVIIEVDNLEKTLAPTYLLDPATTTIAWNASEKIINGKTTLKETVVVNGQTFESVQKRTATPKYNYTYYIPVSDGSESAPQAPAPAKQNNSAAPATQRVVIEILQPTYPPQPQAAATPPQQSQPSSQQQQHAPAPQQQQAQSQQPQQAPQQQPQQYAPPQQQPAQFMQQPQQGYAVPANQGLVAQAPYYSGPVSAGVVVSAPPVYYPPGVVAPYVAPYGAYSYGYAAPYWGPAVGYAPGCVYPRPVCGPAFGPACGPRPVNCGPGGFGPRPTPYYGRR